MERLEGRQLLALLITAESLVGRQNFAFTDDSSITVAEGVRIDAHGGTISFDAPSITIRDGVTLSAAGGDITFKATATLASLPISYLGTAASLVQAISKQKADVVIGSKVTIVGASLTIAATAGDAQTLASIPFVGQIIEPMADIALPYVFDDNFGFPLSVQVKQPGSSITIGSHSTIDVDGAVSIRSDSTATAVGEAIWSRMMDKFVQESGRSDLAHGGFAAGFSYADARATVDLAGRIVSRQGSVDIGTTVTSTAAMKARVTLNQGLQQTNPDNIEVAYAGGMTNATSRVTIGEASQIDAHANVAVTASATDTLTLKAATDSYRDGRVGVVVGTGFTSGTVEVIVNGSIRAGQADVPAALEFNPALAVDFASGAIVFPTAVAFRTGDAVAYSSGRGGSIPGLESGRTYWAIYDPVNPQRLKLAASAADAAAGRAIDFGAGYPTLSGAKGTLPIVSIDPDSADTIRFGFATWPDGSPLFVDGETVQYKATAGQFLGQDNPDGMLQGPLADGAYRVQVVSGGSGDDGIRIRLLDAGGMPVRFNPHAHFVTEDGVICQVEGFDGDAATVAVSIGGSASATTLPPPALLTNGQRVRYVQGFGSVVPGLVDGRDYFTVVDPGTPGVIRLAESRRQAVAADPAVQHALPKLETITIDQPNGGTIEVEGVQPGTGLVFTVDPLLPAGTPVVYRAAAGRPVGGLVDGVTYYAYPLENPFFDADDPQYVVGLRTVADASAPLVELRLRQSLSAGVADFVIDGIDRLSAALSLALPQAAAVTQVDSSLLVGGVATVGSVPAAATQVWTNARSGAFSISLPNGTTRTSTAPIPFDASPAMLMQAINAVGLPGVQVTQAFGRGRYDEPWTLVGSGLGDLEFELDAGGSAWADTTANELQAVSTNASGGTFTLTIDVAGVPRTTAPLACDASAADVARAINDLGGVLAGRVTGSGTADSPWLVGTRVQPLRTGDPVVFRDAWGGVGLGLAHGETLYAIVAPASQQGRDGAVVVRLAATAADALATEPVTVPLATTIAFGAANRGVMTGTRQTLESTNQATGIHLAATLVSDDSVKVVSQNGDQPSFFDYASRGDMSLRRGVWGKLITPKNRFGLMPDEQSALEKQIEDRLGAQKSNTGWTVSAAVAVLKVDNTTRVVVGPKASLATSGSVVIASKVTERVGTSVDGKLCKPTPGNLGVALAVDVADVTNRSHAIVQGGARIHGAAGVTVDAQTVYPWAGQWIGDLVSWMRGAASVSDAVADFHTSDFILNHYVSASTSYFYGKDKASQKLANVFAGSVARVAIANDTVARVEDGVSLNQDGPIAAECPVRVTAATDVAQTAGAGSLYIAMNPLTRGQNAVGFSVGILTIENETRALLGGVDKAADGTPLPSAGQLLVTAGTGGVTVQATSDTLILQQAIGGTDATGFGVSGMAAVIDAQTGSQVTEAAIVGSLLPGGGGRITSAGGVDVEAADTTLLIPVAGSLVLSERRAVGLSTAIALLDRDVTARVGSRDDETLPQVGEVTIAVAKDVQVKATASGVVVPSAIAGVGASRAKPAGGGQNLEHQVGDEPQPVQPKGTWGLGVSGAFTLADVADDVRATVCTTGAITSTAPAAGPDGRPTFGVAARNTTVVVSTAGAVLDRSHNDDGSSATLAGAASLTNATSSVVATVRLATVRGFTLDVTARNARDVVSNAAGGSDEPQPRAGSTQVQIAGSVTINTIKTTTVATVDHVTGEGLAGVTTDATTDEWIWSLAGSGLIDRRRTDGQPEGRRIGIGVGFARNDVVATTRATVVASTLSVASGQMQVTAAETSEVFTFAAGFIWSSAGGVVGDRSWFVEGMFAFVAANSTVEAAIDGGNVDVDGAIDVVATSALLLVTGAGNLLVSTGRAGNLAAGAAWANVGGTISAMARIGNGSVRARRGNLSVRSQTQKADDDPRSESILDDTYTPKRDDAAVWTFAVGVVTSNSTVAADGSVCWNTLSSTRSASIEDSALVQVDEGSLEVRAVDEANIYAGAGAITVKNGAAGAVAAGAAVVRNKVTAKTSAEIVSSNVEAASTGTAGGGITVEALTKGLIGTAAVGGEVAGRVAVGTAVIVNDLTHTVVARVMGSDEKDAGSRHAVTATGDIAVKAEDRSRIGAGAGQVDVATQGIGAGAAAAVNTITSSVEATIADRVDVRSSGGTISVDADAAGEVDAYAFGVVGAFSSDVVGFGGAGSGTGNTLNRRVAAVIESDARIESQGLTVTAGDSGKIVAISGSLDIQSSGSKGVSFAFGVSVAKNTIGGVDSRPSVEAAVRNSSVTAHGSVQVAATSGSKISAITMAGVGSSLGKTFGLAGAGAGSGNTVDVAVSAEISDSIVTQDAGDIDVGATGKASILAIAGGGALAGSLAGSTAAVTVGAAAAVNAVTLATTASIAGKSVIDSAGTLTVDATGDGAIEAWSFGVAGSLVFAAGLKPAFDFTGGGSGSGNTVDMKTTAAIGSPTGTSASGLSSVPSTSVRAGKVGVTAVEHSSIVATAGGGEILLGFRPDTAIGLAVGISITINDVKGTVAADIRDAAVVATDDVNVSASFNPAKDVGANIKSLTIAGSVGAEAARNAVLFPLAGAGSHNTIDVTMAAAISEQADVKAGGVISVSAVDDSTISADTGGAALGFAVGHSFSAAVGVGAAYGKNEITNTVRAWIQNAVATAGKGVDVSASASPSVDALAFGVALTVAASKGAASAAGSGAAGYTTVTSTIDAAVLSATVEATTGGIHVTAQDAPRITTKAGSGAGALAIGGQGGAALAAGVVILETSVGDTVTARIGRSADDAADPTVTAANGAIVVAATSAATVSSLGVAVAATAAVSEAGGAGAGAGARGSVTFGNTISATIESGNVTATTVSVRVVDRDASRENTIGTGAIAGAIAAASIGVSLTETTARNAATARVGSADGKTAPAVTATNGGITVDVRGGHSLFTETVATSVAVGVGGAGAGGHAFTTDTSIFRATVATGARLRATGTLLVQSRGSSDDPNAPDGRLDAQAHGGAGGAAVVGVVIAAATDRAVREATIGDGVDLLGVAGLDLLTTSSPSVHAKSVAVDVGGVAVTVNQSTVTTAGTARAATGRNVVLPNGDVRVIATGRSRLEASQLGVAAGVTAAAGATQTTGESRLATEAELGAATITAGSRTGDLVVRAVSRDVGTSLEAVSGSGGVFSGFGTLGQLTDATTTRATIRGGTIHSGVVDIGVDRRNLYDVAVDSTNIAVLVGVGITQASVTAAQTAGDTFDRVRVGIDPDTTIVARDRVTVVANHEVSRTATQKMVRGVGGAIGSYDNASATIDVDVPAVIAIDRSVSITSGDPLMGSPGGITILPTAFLQVSGETQLHTGGLATDCRFSTSLSGSVMPQVTLGDGIQFVSHGRLDVGTVATVVSAVGSSGWTAGGIGSIGTTATADVTVDQRVLVGRNARLQADGSLSLTPGDEPSGGGHTYVSLDANATADVYGAFTDRTAKAQATVKQHTELSFAGSADVSSGGSMYLSARSVNPEARAHGTAKSHSINGGTDSNGHVDTDNKISLISLNGTFVAGRENSLVITIDSTTADVTTNVDSVFGVPVNTAWQKLEEFSPVRHIGEAGYGPDVRPTLLSGVAQGDVVARRFVAVRPVMVSGGSVTVTGDTIASAPNTTITANVGSITITNSTPDYLLLDSGLAIANIQGGKVSFSNSQGVRIDHLPDTLHVNTPDESQMTPEIRINLSAPKEGGDAVHGPALFVEAPLVNLGGKIFIHNESGSFGQTSTIAAKEIVIETPNGVFAVDTPNDAWNAAGTPAAQLADKMTWPGGDPRLGRADASDDPVKLYADQAVMYAINAMSSPRPGGAGWTKATSDRELNQWVYGDPVSDQSTYVFFGGSVPQYKEQYTNKQEWNEQLAKDARTDRQAYAYQMTTLGYDKGKSAYMPGLQHLEAIDLGSSDVSAVEGNAAVKGQVIVVNAKVANINGTIEAGGVESGPKSVVIPASVEAALREYQDRYARRDATQPLWRIDALLDTQSPGDQLIGASFDARTGRIILDEAVSPGGGSVSIKGRIINTASVAGKILVKGSSGDIVVRNDTSLPLVTGVLQTTLGERQAVVRITDLSIADVAQQQTTYVYDGERIRKHIAGALVDTISDSTISFQPQRGSRWQWQTAATMHREVDVNDDTRQSDAWPGVYAGSWSFENPDSPWTTLGGDAAGDVILAAPDMLPFTQTMQATYPSDNQRWFSVPYGKADFKTGFSDNHTFYYPTRVSLTMTMSVKADNPIGIDFSGTSVGKVSVVSMGDVLVGGGIVAETVTINSTGGRLDTASGGFVQASADRDTANEAVAVMTGLRLDAAAGIGNAASPFEILAGRVWATTTKGDVFLDGRAGGAAIPLGLLRVAAPEGKVSIVAAGDVRRVSDVVQAAAVSVTSVAGAIGSAAAPLKMAAGGLGTLQVDAVAAGDIHLEQITGDMLVGAITSPGAVYIVADGDIYSADTWTIDAEAAEKRFAALLALGAADPDAYLPHVRAFEGTVKSRYVLYHTLQENRDNLPFWRTRAAAAGVAAPGADGPSDEQIRGYLTELDSELAAFFAATFGPGWRSLPQFQAFDAGYVYVATAAQQQELGRGAVLTADQLRVSFNSSALEATNTGEPVTGRINVTARSVFITSTRGSVGKNDPPITISAADLAAGRLTDVQKQELALAASPGDAAVAQDGGLVLNVRRPIVLAVSGRVDVDAPAGIAIEQRSGDLHVGRLTSRDGLVSVVADGDIRNASEIIDMWGTSIGFQQPSRWTSFGNAGASVSTEGLTIPGYPQTRSGTWFDEEVPTGSFRASFTYEANKAANPGDGLAFVLRQGGTSPVGETGSGLGYRGIGGGRKVGFLINVYGSSGVFFDKDGSWTGGGFQKLPFELTGRPVYVTLVYVATARTMTITVSDQPQPVGTGARSATFTYSNVDLAGVLGPSAVMGFTSGTGNAATMQQVTQFAFASDSPLAAERVTLSGQADWVLTSSAPGRGGFVLSTPAEGPTLTFPNEPELAAAAWYPSPVRISTDFRVTFRYRYEDGQSAAGPGNGMALVFQNSSAGTSALGDAGGELGYTGIPGRKVGYLLNIYAWNPYGDGVGTRFDRLGGASGQEYNACRLPVGTWIDVALTYDSTTQTLKELLTSTSDGRVVTLREATTTNVDLPGLLGSDTALLGVTAASGAATAVQQIQAIDFFSPNAAEPDDAGEWELNGSTQSLANGVLTIPATTFTATSSWYGRPVSTAGFEAGFTYQADRGGFVDPEDQGLAFVLQQSPDGYAAIGDSGSGLGFLGMPGDKRVGLLLDIGGVSGVRFTVGPQDGSFDSVPWLAGGPVSVRLAYDAQAHSFTATLTSTYGYRFSRTWSGIDLESAVGSRAIMGFTSGSGASPVRQVVSNFFFRDRDGIESFRTGSAATPAVRLWSTFGSIGASGAEVRVQGTFQADAQAGSIHTNPPPAPATTLVAVGGKNADGVPITNSAVMNVTTVAPNHTVLYSTDNGRTWAPAALQSTGGGQMRRAALLQAPGGGRTWQVSIRAREGLNDVLVTQVNSRGFRSTPERVRFVFDRTAPQAPRPTLPDRKGFESRTGQLKLAGVEQGASVSYSVNGGAWSSTYTPVEGWNVVRIRQADVAGNMSKPAVVWFVLKTRVTPLIVSLMRDTGPSRTDRVTTDGRLTVRGREFLGSVHYSVDGGTTWARTFAASPGVNRVLVRQVDRLGNTSEPTAFEFTLEQPKLAARPSAAAWWQSIVQRTTS